jgi:predicted O-methyltransferase YrrM
MQGITDKNTSGMDKIYERILTPYKGKAISFLEIGILEGGSLLMFEEMLPDAKIYGFDILERPECLKDSKVITKVIDQNNSEEVEEFAKEAGGYDVVIDDGSHFTKETGNCFNTLWKYVKEGGLYIIEDWIVGVKVKDEPNIAYAQATGGMDALVFNIALKKTELGISSIEIIVKENWQSYAVFKKGKNE